MTTLTSPQPLATSTPPLPPSPRDFEIHRLHLVHYMSTWRLADKYQISQTRVRQIIKAVNQWLAATLPAKTELEVEQETHLAQHIAADQLQHQLEVLQNYFDGSGDPKYSRQQTRVILALARLGIIPGSIDALAADAECGAGVSPAVHPSQPEASGRASDSQPTLDLGLETLDSRPPLRDFSPIAPPSSSSVHSLDDAQAPTSSPAGPSRQIYLSDDDALEGLNHMEKRLLTLIDETTPGDSDRLESLNNTLANIHRQKATIELRLSPNNPGATINSPTHHSPTPLPSA